MVLIISVALLLIALAFIVHQWLELRAANESIAWLLADSDELQASLLTTVRTTRLLLDVALRQNRKLQREIECHLVSLELVLGEVA